MANPTPRSRNFANAVCGAGDTGPVFFSDPMTAAMKALGTT